jgi:hypothetical protein
MKETDLVDPTNFHLDVYKKLNPRLQDETHPDTRFGSGRIYEADFALDCQRAHVQYELTSQHIPVKINEKKSLSDIILLRPRIQTPGYVSVDGTQDFAVARAISNGLKITADSFDKGRLFERAMIYLDMMKDPKNATPGFFGAVANGLYAIGKLDHPEAKAKIIQVFSEPEYNEAKVTRL